MRIGVIADTHLTDPSTDLPQEVYKWFASVDLILHAGDIYAPWVLDRLEAIAPVLGIRGYPDPPDPRLEWRRIVRADGLNIAMIHNIGFPETPIDTVRGLTFPEDTRIRDVLQRKFEGEVNVVVFGDTHEEVVVKHQGVLFVNPGSPLYPGIKHKVGDPGTIALIEVSGGEASANIIQLSSLA